MNHIHRLVFNAQLGVWQAVAEIGKNTGKGVGAARRGRARGRQRLALAMAALAASSSLFAASLVASALPQGGQITAGSATVSSLGNAMTVQQNSDRAAINWNTFSIGRDASVRFQQPNATSVVLNRVVGHEKSIIEGALSANGRVFLLNANGVLFTKNAQVNVAALLASSLDQSDADFMAGKTNFKAAGHAGSVINLGTIKAADGGYVALMGPQVVNEGVITAKLGSAILAGGSDVSLNFHGNSLVGVTLNQGALNALVENKNAIYADGGTVVLTAKGLDEVMRTVVNNTGEIRAQTVANQGGKIYLLGGMGQDRIEVGGTLDASAPASGDGGFIETSAAHVAFQADSKVTTRAAHGRTGTFLIDPNDFTIAATGGNMTGAQVAASLASNNVQISTATQGTAGGNGDIFVKDDVTWSSGNTLTLTAERNIAITSTLDASGDRGGKVVLEYGQGALANGNTASYNFGLTSAGFAGKIKLQAGQNFQTKLGSDGSATDWTVITALGTENANNDGTLQGLRDATPGHYVLGADIDASGTASWNSGAGFTPIGFESGKFDGLGHTVDGLTIHRTTDNNGLFGYVSDATLRNVSITRANIKGSSNIGALVGYFEIDSDATSGVFNAYSTGAIGGNVVNAQVPDGIGGLVGQMDSGAIKNSFSNADVESDGLGTTVGGLAGNVTYATISNSYATGAVKGSLSVGGLLGRTSATIVDSYATGDVTGSQFVGGLVGEINQEADIQNTYAAGRVSGTSDVGGFAGRVNPGQQLVLTNNYWDTTTTAQTTAYNLVTATDSVTGVRTTVPVQSEAGKVMGKTTAELKTMATYDGTGMTVAGDPSLSGVYPRLRSLTGGLATGTSIWAMAGVTPVIPVTPVTPVTPTPEPTKTESPRVIATLAALPALNSPRTTPPETPVAPRALNVTSAPAYLTELLGGDGPLSVVSSPNGAEAAQWVNLSDADRMVSGASSGEREMRVPASRNSLAQILQGGVKLPAGVEQQLYVVKGQ